jgi:hypothetical protein
MPKNSDIYLYIICQVPTVAIRTMNLKMIEFNFFYFNGKIKLFQMALYMKLNISFVIFCHKIIVRVGTLWQGYFDFAKIWQAFYLQYETHTH